MPSAEQKPVVTRERIAQDLARLGLAAGEVVFVHSSLSSLGWVEGGAEAVVDAFLDVLGAEGLLVVPTLTWTFAHGEYARYAFDPAETPSRVGRISETVRRRPGAFRSAHPTHSIAGLGRRAEELVRGHDQTSTFGKDGPYRRYVDWGAKIVFLGVELRCNTTLHAVEDWLDMPYLQEEEALVRGPDGKPRIVKVTKSPAGDRDFYRKGSKVERLLEKTGMVRRGKVGEADTRWLPSQEMVAAVVEGIYQEPTLLLCDEEDCDFCRTYRRPTEDHIKRHRPRI